MQKIRNKPENAGSRVLCSEIVRLKWKEPSGKTRRAVGDLEAISPSKAWLQLDDAIPEATSLSIGVRRVEISGIVRKCTFADASHCVSVEFDPGTLWSRRRFTPRHLFDPGALMVDNLMRELKPEITEFWKPRVMGAQR